jgi:hypothetical protein
MKDLSVILGTGLGLLRFGMLPAEIEEILGVLPLSERVEDGEYSYLRQEYPGYRAVFFFDQNKDFRLSSVEIGEDPTYTLFGEPLFPKHRQQILRILQERLPESERLEIVEEEYEPLRETSLWVPSLRATFYLDKAGMLQELQWSPFYSPDDLIIWPERLGGDPPL